METNPDIVMRMKYMHRDMLCSVIDIDFRHKKVYVTNKTDKILLRAFGVVAAALKESNCRDFAMYEPTWIDYRGNRFGGCRSRNFLGEQEELITAADEKIQHILLNAGLLSGSALWYDK